MCTPIKIGITINTAGVSYSVINAYKIGKLVHVSGVLVPREYGQYLNMFGVDDYPPIHTTQFPIGGYEGGSGEGYIQPDKVVQMSFARADVVDTGMRFNFTYLTNH